MNHNEIEKKRRDQQRLQLDILREQIPKLRLERPSAVTTIVGAIEHINVLTQRIQELETHLEQAGLVIPPTTLLVPAEGNSQQFITVPAEPHMMPGKVLLNFLQTQNGSSPSPLRTEAAFSQPASPSGRRMRSIAASTIPIAPAMAHENFDPNVAIDSRNGSIKRRDSAMLLPTNDPNTFLFGKRDSLQNFFAGSLPTIFDDMPRTEFHCTKCQRGVENLIMIDCDNCHDWYHIRCVGIDGNHIPLQWRCNECANRTGFFPYQSNPAYQQ